MGPPEGLWWHPRGDDGKRELMPMDLTPNTSNPDLSFVKVESAKDTIYELSVESLERILNSTKNVQRELSSTTIYDRMDIFEEMDFHPDVIVPLPGKWPGWDQYINWKLYWIDFFKPIAVIDDMKVFAYS